MMNIKKIISALSASAMIFTIIPNTIAASGSIEFETDDDIWFTSGDGIIIKGTVDGADKIICGEKSVDVEDEDWSMVLDHQDDTKGKKLEFKAMNGEEVIETATFNLKVDSVGPVIEPGVFSGDTYYKSDVDGKVWFAKDDNTACLNVKITDETSGVDRAKYGDISYADGKFLIKTVQDEEAYIYAYDEAGNKTKTESKVAYYIDNIAPTVDIEYIKNGDNVDIASKCIDNESGIYRVLYSTDEGETFTRYTEKFSIPKETKSLLVKVVDNVGNTAEKTYDGDSWVDVLPLSIEYNGEEQNLLRQNFIADDDNTIEYSISATDSDGVQQWTKYTTDIPKAKKVGKYNVKYKIIRKADKFEPKEIFVDCEITKKSVKVTGITAEDKVYDGKTDAKLKTTDMKIDGLVEGETLTATVKGTFEDKNAGDDKTVKITSITLSGADSNNYILNSESSQKTATAKITKKDITITAYDKQSKAKEKLVELTYKYDKNDLISGDSIIGNLETNADKSKVGIYDITIGSLVVATYVSGTNELKENYNIIFESGTYTVKKNSSGGSSGGGSSSSGSSGKNYGSANMANMTKVSSLKIPEAADKMVFDGWYSDEALTNRLDDNATVSTLQKVYPKFKKDPKYTINMYIGKTEAVAYGTNVENDVAPLIKNDRTMLPARFVAENLGATIEWDGATKTVTVTSADGTKVIKITNNSSNATVNGTEISLDSPAFIENDRIYTPVRFIAENLGATVEWVSETREVVISK